MKKKLTAAVLVLCICLMLPLVTFADDNQAATEIIVSEDSGLVPVRAFFEDKGADVDWDYLQWIISITLDESRVMLYAQYPVAMVNNIPVPLRDGVTLFANRSFVTEHDMQLILNHLIVIDWELVPLSDVAASFMTAFVESDMASAIRFMSTEMQALGAEFFANMHFTMFAQMGSFLEWRFVSYYEQHSYMIFNVLTENTIGYATYVVTINANGEVQGFIFTDFEFVPVPPAFDAPYTVSNVIVGKDTMWELDGILTMPRVASIEYRVPAVVLIHGSGSHNMDSSIFDNRPFYDIATYFSSNGIAVLRYNQRTWTHGAAFIERYGAEFEVWHETVESALQAVELLRKDPRVGNVYIAGLSLGGMLAPHIAEVSEADGVIILSASPRPLYEVQYDQNINAIEEGLAAGLLTDEEANDLLAMVAEQLELARRLPGMTRAEKQNLLIFGIHAIYHSSILESLPLPVLSRNIIPALIIHGDSDFQVFTDSDFNAFVAHTEGYPHIQTKLYYGVTHILTRVQTHFSNIMEYMVTTNVCTIVLSDIVQWIMSIETMR